MTKTKYSHLSNETHKQIEQRQKIIFVRTEKCDFGGRAGESSIRVGFAYQKQTKKSIVKLVGSGAKVA